MSWDYMAERVDQHDIQCGKMAGELFKNKFFVEESITYGTAYWLMGKRWFFVSDDYIKVHQFTTGELLKDIYCTPINYLYRKEQVLEGESERINRRNKMDLCKSMKQSYSPKSFVLLQSFAETRNLDVAQEILAKIRYSLEGTLDIYALDVFSSINRYAFDMKKVTLLTFINNMTWAEKRRKELLVDNLVSGNYIRSFSGFAYIDEENHIKYYDNAMLELTIKKRDELIHAKKMVSPVFEKTYAFDNVLDLQKISEAFSDELKKRFDVSFFKIIQCIYDLPSPIDSRDLQNKVCSFEDKLTDAEKDMINYYEAKWGIG